MIIKEKSLVVGICGNNISTKELDYLCSVYGKYINSFYTSPPFGDYYDWKGPTVPSDFTYENCKTLKDQIDTIKKYNIGIRMTLNNPVKFNEHAVQDVNHFIEMYGRPEYIIAMQENIEEFHNNFDIPLTLSCMNKLSATSEDIVNMCDIVVLNSEHNYNLDLMKFLKAKHKKIELIVNNACGYYCNKCCDESCTANQNKVIEEFGLEKTLALQALFPCELQFLEPYIDLWKISNRPSTFIRTKNCIDRWINGISLDQLKSELITVTDYMAAYNMAAFRDKSHFDKIVNFDKVVEYKNEIWSEKLGKDINLWDLNNE